MHESSVFICKSEISKCPTFINFSEIVDPRIDLVYVIGKVVNFLFVVGFDTSQLMKRLFEFQSPLVSLSLLLSNHMIKSVNFILKPIIMPDNLFHFMFYKLLSHYICYQRGFLEILMQLVGWAVVFLNFYDRNLV